MSSKLHVDPELEERRPYFLTGASGLLGLNLAKYLTSKGADVCGVTRRSETNLKGLRCFAHDLRETDRVLALIREFRPVVLIHCAAATDVDWCERNADEAFSINTHPCRDLTSAMNEVGGAFVLISTDSVFDGRIGNYAEDDHPRPLNAYAKSKLAAEQLVAERAERWIIIRTNIYGWNGQNKNSLAEWILQELRARRSITGFEDVIFAPLLASDLGPLIEKMVEKKMQGLYHAGASGAVSKYDFARRLAEIHDLDAALIRPGKLADAKLGAPRPLNTSLFSKKLETEFGQSLPSIDDGLKRFRDQGMNGWAQDLKKHIL